MHTESNPAHGEVFDTQELMLRCLNNVALVERLLGVFSSRLDEDLCALQQAADTGDTDSLVRVAHRLKGASANMAAHALCDRLARIEQQARSGQLDDIHGHLEELRRQRAQFRETARAAWPAGAAG